MPRKKAGRVEIQCRVRPELRDELKALARQEGIGIELYVEHILDEHLAAKLALSQALRRASTRQA